MSGCGGGSVVEYSHWRAEKEAEEGPSSSVAAGGEGKGRRRRRRRGSDGDTDSSSADTRSSQLEQQDEDVDDDDDQVDDSVFGSTSLNSFSTVCTKESYLLLKGDRSFKRYKRRYFRLCGKTLLLARTREASAFDELYLAKCTVVERASKRSPNAFQLITSSVVLTLRADNRRDMADWLSALTAVSNDQLMVGSGVEDYLIGLNGAHSWQICSHGRPTFCNVCREALSGVAWHGLSCEVCKLKAHKRCSTLCVQVCKWTTLDSIPPACSAVDQDGWLEGNLPMGARCSVCERACGSVMRLQDRRCLWCGLFVHEGCAPSKQCVLGPARLSLLPPIALRLPAGRDGPPRLSSSPIRCAAGGGGGQSPLLVLVNSRSGDNQGVRVLRRFKRLLNPIQVFDLATRGGPDLGLTFFALFPSFRVLVCGGDGSVSWILSSLDRLQLHSKCQLGVLPLGTGNDLSRVLGWGHSFDDNTQLPLLLEQYERAKTRMLDRWSVLTYEGPKTSRAELLAANRSYELLTTHKISTVSAPPEVPIKHYEDSVVEHLSNILNSDDNAKVISSARVLCETVKDFISNLGDAAAAEGSGEHDVSDKCALLRQKLDSLLSALSEDWKRAAIVEESGQEAEEEESSCSDSVPEMSVSSDAKCRMRQRKFVQRDAVMSRVNSLKKAFRQIIDHAEQAVDEQNELRNADGAAVGRKAWGQYRQSGRACGKVPKAYRRPITVSFSGVIDRRRPATHAGADRLAPFYRSSAAANTSSSPEVADGPDLSGSCSSGIGPTASSADEDAAIIEAWPPPAVPNEDGEEEGAMTATAISPLVEQIAKVGALMETVKAASSEPTIGGPLFLSDGQDLQPHSRLSQSDSSVFDLEREQRLLVSSTEVADEGRGGRALLSLLAPSVSQEVADGQADDDKQHNLSAFERNFYSTAGSSMIAEVLLRNAKLLTIAAAPPSLRFGDVSL